MTKKHFVQLADAIRYYNANSFPHGTNTVSPLQFTHTQILKIKWFIPSQLAAEWIAHRPRTEI